MSLNIKNPEVHDLAREVADITGESMTVAVREALRERLQRLQTDEVSHLADRLVVIGQDCAQRLPQAVRDAEHGELLYDESGLPA
jgi:antitoxin VapB